MGAVEKFYDGQCEAEWQRLARHRLEFEITKMELDRHIPAGSRVLDVGGGPGRYSIHLAGRGCRVTLADLSANNVRRAEEEARKAGVELEKAVRCNALELDALFAGQEYDAVLCMGPLYHLPEEADRIRSVEQCLSLLKEGGIFAAAFISAYAPIFDCMRNYPERIAAGAQHYLSFLENGRNYAVEGFTDAWFEHPGAIGGFMARFPLMPVSLIAAEGLGILAEPALTSLPEERFMQWVRLLHGLAGNPETLGACEHLLYMGRRMHCQPPASAL